MHQILVIKIWPKRDLVGFTSLNLAGVSDITQPSGTPITFSGQGPLWHFLSLSGPPTSGAPVTIRSSHPIVMPLAEVYTKMYCNALYCSGTCLAVVTI